MKDQVADLASRIEAEPGALSAPQLAGYLGVARSTVYEMASNGRIPHLRFGNVVRFDPAITAAWLRQKKVAA